MASLHDQLSADLKDAMRARDTVRLDALRSALSGFTYKRSETGRDLTSDDEREVMRRLVKQRNDSLAEFEKAGRADLATKERLERDLLLAYLPTQKSAEEVRAIVKTILAGLPADGRTQGAAMKAVMPPLKGLADGNVVRQIVSEELAAGV